MLIKNHKDIENIQFIGDPHLTSIQISSRNDDVHTLDTILDKLSQAAKISHEKKCYTIILGDLFDNDKENNIVLLNKLIRVLKEFYIKPITVIGNHEKTENVINDKNMITTLVESNLLDVFNVNEITVQLNFNNEQVEVGATNYGSIIPNKIKKKSTKTDKVIWITHHDLMFKDYYPGSSPIYQIEGVCLAVNGHMHGTQPQVQTKMTTWCCPGNILRQKTDMSEHIPSVWLWNPTHHNENQEKLIQHELKYKKNIFRKLEIIEPTIKNNYVIDESKQDNVKLKFIELSQLSLQEDKDNNKTSDKELVKEYMNTLFELQKIPQEMTKELLHMLENIEV